MQAIRKHLFKKKNRKMADIILYSHLQRKPNHKEDGALA
jgi:hypothetical protein